MKFARSVFVLMLIPLMVLSAGGFNVFTHMCHKTGERIVSFQAPESCGHDAEKRHEHSRSCCHAQVEKGTSCCEDHHVFLRTINELSDNDNQCDLPDGKVCELYDQSVKSKEQKVVISKEYLFYNYSAPPERSAKYMVVKYNQKKLDCCSI